MHQESLFGDQKSNFLGEGALSPLQALPPVGMGFTSSPHLTNKTTMN